MEFFAQQPLLLLSVSSFPQDVVLALVVVIVVVFATAAKPPLRCVVVVKKDEFANKSLSTAETERQGNVIEQKPLKERICCRDWATASFLILLPVRLLQRSLGRW